METEVTIRGQFVPFLQIFGCVGLCLTEIRYICNNETGSSLHADWRIPIC